MHLCLFADVYGFGSRIVTAIDDLAIQLSRFHQNVDRTINRRASLDVKRLAFSDSLFVIQEIEHSALAGLEAFVTLTIEIYSASLEAGLPLRGCITAGELQATDHAFLGVPVIAAVEFEKRAHLPLIYVPAFTLANLERDAGLAERDSLRVVGPMRDVAFGDGITRCCPLIPRPPTLLEETAEANYIKLTKSSDFVGVARAAKAWREVQNLVRMER